MTKYFRIANQILFINVQIYNYIFLKINFSSFCVQVPLVGTKHDKQSKTFKTFIVLYVPSFYVT